MLKKCKWIVFVLILILLGSVSAQAANMLVLPAGTTEIHAHAFYGDTAIGEVTLPEGLLRIESQAFAESSVTKINLPSSLTFIAEDAFENCNRLEHVTVQAGTYAYTRAHEIGLFDLRALISGSVKEAVAGESIVWTAKAMNGVSPYKYLFEVYRDGEKIDSRAYTAEDSYTYQFTRAGEYYAIAKIKDDDGNVASAKSAIVTVTANTPVIESVNCNLSEIKTAEEVRWTVSVKKGTPPYTYAFALTQGDQVVAESENSTGEYSFTFETAGDYILSVTVTDAYQESASCILPLSVSLTPVSIQNISCSHETLVAETAISWTVNATAGAKPYAYSYEILSGSEVIFAAADQTANTCSYTFEASGEYTLSVTVTDAEGNTAAYSQSLDILPQPLCVVSVKANDNALMLGETIMWTAEALGGEKPLRYAFDLFKDGEEIDGTTFGEANTFSFTPDEEGVYSVCARVRDNRNTTVELLSEGTQITFATPAKYFSYSISSQSVTIRGYIGRYTDVIIPSTIDGYIVTSIGNRAFNNCSDLTSVTIPEGMTSIGNYSFSGCSSLTSVNIPEGVTSIGNYAFYNCSSLTSVMIPAGVTSIGDHAFYKCNSLTSVTIPDGITSIASSTFSGCSSLTSVNIPEGVTSIGDDAFSGCSSLTSVTIPEGITSIASSTFSGCSSLTSVTIPEGVENIGKHAFSACRSLTYVTIPKSVTSIGSSAFYNCSSLESVMIPEGVTNIGDFTFWCCSSLMSVMIPEGVTNIGDYAFYNCENLENMSIPASVTSIGNYAFKECSGLTNVTIPEGVTIIGNYAFHFCSSLTSVSIPASVTIIGDYAFCFCSSLKNITLQEGVTNIGKYAFYGCSSLESVTIPKGVTNIGDSTFLSCSSLTSVTIPESVMSIGNDAFKYCSKLTVYCYEGSYVHAYCKNNSVCYKLIVETTPTPVPTASPVPTAVPTPVPTATPMPTEVPTPVPTETPVPTAVPTSEPMTTPAPTPVQFGWEVNASGENVTITGYTGSDPDVVIPSTINGYPVTGIGERAFYSCNDLISVTIPDSVTSIGCYAFSGCSILTSVTIPESVTSIGNYAFSDCCSLTSVTIPESVTSIGNYTFSHCYSLMDVTIMEGITSIGNNAFYYCYSLMGVTIPASVTSIGSFAFNSCSSLRRVTIPDSVTSIGNSAFYNCRSLIVSCYKGSYAHTYCVNNNVKYQLITD